SGFVQALHSYRSGNLTREELLREIERQLDTGEADSGTLLAALNQEQARERLPGNLHIELVRKLLHRRESPMPPLTSLAAPADAAARTPEDDAATVLVDNSSGAVRLVPAARRRA